MTPVQTQVRPHLRRLLAGVRLDSSRDSIDTRAIEGIDPEMAFGKAVIRGTEPGLTVILPSDTFDAENFEGVAMNHFLSELNLDGSLSIDEGSAIGVLNWGRTVVYLAPGITPQYGDSIYVIPSGDNRGKFTNQETGNIEVQGRFLREQEGELRAVELFRRG